MKARGLPWRAFLVATLCDGWIAAGTKGTRGAFTAKIRECFAAARNRFGLRLVELSVLGNHVHLIIEARDPVRRRECEASLQRARGGLLELARTGRGGGADGASRMAAASRLETRAPCGPHRAHRAAGLTTSYLAHPDGACE